MDLERSKKEKMREREKKIGKKTKRTGFDQHANDDALVSFSRSEYTRRYTKKCDSLQMSEI